MDNSLERSGLSYRRSRFNPTHIQNLTKKNPLKIPRVEMCLVPIGDGLILIQKKFYIPLTH